MFSPSDIEIILEKNKQKAHFALICENASCTVEQVLMQ